MIYSFQLTRGALDDLEIIDETIRKRILKKINFYATQLDPLSYAKKLHDFQGGQYRFRIGDYRAIFDIDNQGNITILVIVAVRHRREAYN